MAIPANPPDEISRNEHAPITRAEAPVSGISMPAHLGVGSDLVDSIDYVVLIQVMFDTASGRKVSPILTWERLQERGIRSTKNRAELVGKNTVYEAFTRIIEAGYIQRYEARNAKHPGRKGPVSYRVYDNPAWNPAWQCRHVGSDPLGDDSAKPQVGMLPGTGDGLTPEPQRDSKAAGRNASRNQGSGVQGSGVPGRGTRRVPAGRNASPVPGPPPHPPEVVETTSPYPLNSGERSRTAQAEEGGDDFAPEEIAAAEEFLLKLDSPWTVGGATARKLAPLLLSSMHDMKWPGIAEVDPDQLRRSLLTDPPEKFRAASILRIRINDLPLYETVGREQRAASTTRRRFIGSGL